MVRIDQGILKRVARRDREVTCCIIGEPGNFFIEPIIDSVTPINKELGRKVIAWRREGGLAKGSIRSENCFIILSKGSRRQFSIVKNREISDLGGVQRQPHLKEPPRATDMANRLARE
jgi:hypothetical protein